jgi:hypothetical protein
MAEAGKPFEFAYDYHQLYLYDADRQSSDDDDNGYLDALDAATETGLTVGARSEIVDVLMPRQENFGAMIEVSLTADPPPLRGGADHVVEFDVPLPSGCLVLEGSGGSGREEVRLGSGTYRVRLTGHNFEAAAAWRYEDTGNPSDRYVLELWPTIDAHPPVELRRWPGYADHL